MDITDCSLGLLSCLSVHLSLPLSHSLSCFCSQSVYVPVFAIFSVSWSLYWLACLFHSLSPRLSIVFVSSSHVSPTCINLLFEICYIVWFLCGILWQGTARHFCCLIITLPQWFGRLYWCLVLFPWAFEPHYDPMCPVHLQQIHRTVYRSLDLPHPQPMV